MLIFDQNMNNTKQNTWWWTTRFQHGFLTKTNDFSFENMKNAVVYGSALASFSVEKFGTERMCNLAPKEVFKRLQLFKNLTQFDIELT